MDCFIAYIQLLHLIVEPYGGTIIEEMEDLLKKSPTDKIWQSLNITLRM